MKLILVDQLNGFDSSDCLQPYAVPGTILYCFPELKGLCVVYSLLISSGCVSVPGLNKTS